MHEIANRVRQARFEVLYNQIQLICVNVLFFFLDGLLEHDSFQLSAAERFQLCEQLQADLNWDKDFKDNSLACDLCRWATPHST